MTPDSPTTEVAVHSTHFPPPHFAHVTRRCTSGLSPDNTVLQLQPHKTGASRRHMLFPKTTVSELSFDQTDKAKT